MYLNPNEIVWLCWWAIKVSLRLRQTQSVTNSCMHACMHACIHAYIHTSIHPLYFCNIMVEAGAYRAMHLSTMFTIINEL